MENITNLGSCYTNNFNQQEITFQSSDYVVLISKAEEEYYNQFGYNLFDTETKVIYNSYQPKYDKEVLEINYDSNTLGYIGRHVPRKRPELPIVSVNKNKIDINVINMGVDYDKYDNEYWRKLEKEYKESLKIIQKLTFTLYLIDHSHKNLYFLKISHHILSIHPLDILCFGMYGLSLHYLI